MGRGDEFDFGRIGDVGEYGLASGNDLVVESAAARGGVDAELGGIAHAQAWVAGLGQVNETGGWRVGGA